MRTDRERIAAMHQRAEEIQIEDRRRKIRLAQTLSFAACFVLLIVCAMFMPAISGHITPGVSPGEMNASMFAGNAALGYIVIAIIAFFLGISVTVFCFRLRRWKDENDKENKHFDKKTATKDDRE